MIFDASGRWKMLHDEKRRSVCIQKFPDWVDKEIYTYNNKHSLRRNIKGNGGKTHEIDSQNSDTAAPSGRELYHLQFSLLAASPETFGCTLVQACSIQSVGYWDLFPWEQSCRVMKQTTHLQLLLMLRTDFQFPRLCTSVSILTRLRSEEPWFYSGRGRDFFSQLLRPGRNWGRRDFYPVGTGGLCPGGKRPRRQADHSPPSSAKVKKYEELFVQLPYIFMGRYVTLLYRLMLPKMEGWFGNDELWRTRKEAWLSLRYYLDVSWYCWREPHEACGRGWECLDVS
jgi:hypothetical protein